MKKRWEKPELIVFVRNRPDEGVLDDCKTFSSMGPAGTAGTGGNCARDDGNYLYACQAPWSTS